MARGPEAAWQSLDEIGEYHEDASDSLRHFFASGAAQASLRFLYTSTSDLSLVLDRDLRETEQRSCLAILASVEAAFRVDYESRCLDKKKDPLSRSFRQLHKRYGLRISFEDDVLRLWAEHRTDLKALIGELRGAMKLRHWLAHGRYWEPRLGRKRYDYTEVYLLGLRVEAGFPLLA